MPWVKIDDGFFDNPTNRALGAAGRDLFVAGLAYCAKGLTDGRIAKDDLPLVLAQAQAKRSTVTKLVKAGRWIEHDDHYEVDEYLTYQPSKAKVLADREKEKEKKRRQRSAGAFRPQGTTPGTPPRDAPGESPATRPDPSLTCVTPVVAASSATDPHQRQQLIDQACKTLAEERAERRDDVGPGWIPATAKGIATDHHQVLHQHLVAHPDATVAQLIDLIEGTQPHRSEPANTSAHLRPVAQVLAHNRPVSPEERAEGLRIARTIPLRHHPEDVA